METSSVSGDGSRVIREFTVGCRIRVVAPPKHAGMLGHVLEIDGEGSVKVKFPKGMQWVGLANLDHLEVVEGPPSLAANVELDGNGIEAANATSSGDGIEAEAADMLGALHFDDTEYNFKLVTSEISKRAAPGDAGTNAKYQELMILIEKTLKARSDAARLNWEVDATRTASDEELLLGEIHTHAFIRAMAQRTAEAQRKGDKLNQGDKDLRNDISAGWTEDTETAARTGVASLIDCAKDVFARVCVHGFVLARPPSHHAVGNAEFARNGSQRDLPFGFCHLNSIASAIANLREDHRKLRVCIFDFDVHPGNGNEDTFWNDPTVLTISIHQPKIFGNDMCRAEYVGGPDALGSVFNLPMLAGAQDTDYHRAVNECIIPEIKKFKPDMLFLAAGFDAMKEDPYAKMELTSFWYGWCVAELMRLKIPIVLNLEGGYDPKASARAVNECVSALAGTQPEEFRSRMTLGPQRAEYQAHTQKMHDVRQESLRAARTAQEQTSKNGTGSSKNGTGSSKKGKGYR